MMQGYINQVLAKVPSDMKGMVSTLAANHLYEIDKESQLLDTDWTDLLHHSTAQLL